MDLEMPSPESMNRFSARIAERSKNVWKNSNSGRSPEGEEPLETGNFSDVISVYDVSRSECTLYYDLESEHLLISLD
ncbi:MAG: hypothetical protein IKF90_01705 [Parasporobacterium sp.]|nr:hypothetical protein [Parasporobacterium sp.]